MQNDANLVLSNIFALLLQLVYIGVFYVYTIKKVSILAHVWQILHTVHSPHLKSCRVRANNSALYLVWCLHKYTCVLVYIYTRGEELCKSLFCFVKISAILLFSFIVRVCECIHMFVVCLDRRSVIDVWDTFTPMHLFFFHKIKTIALGLSKLLYSCWALYAWQYNNTCITELLG